MAYTRLGENLVVHHGAINVGILYEGPRALLIDYGDGDVGETLEALGVGRVELAQSEEHLEPIIPYERSGTADTYAGVQTCRGCHAKAYAAWEESAHVRTLETLKPRNNELKPPNNGLKPPKPKLLV